MASDRDRAELLWRILERYDHYNAVGDAKAAALLAYNGVVIGAVMQANVNSWLAGVRSPSVHVMASTFLTAAALAGVASIYWSARGVYPHRSSPGRSAVYFSDVASQSTHRDYKEALKALDDAAAADDLALQAFEVARGLTSKFQNVRKAMLASCAQFVALCLALALREIY